MNRYEFCNTILHERYKTKHNQSKEHKLRTNEKVKENYYSNLIMNRHVIKDVKVIRFKDIFNPYFIEHTKKFNFFTVCISLRLDVSETPRNHKINVSSYVTYNIQSENYTTYTTELANDVLHRVKSIYLSHDCSAKIIPQIEIVFKSDPKDITREHYVQQPKSMLCRKLTRRFNESTSPDFEYKWLPEAFENL